MTDETVYVSYEPTGDQVSLHQTIPAHRKGTGATREWVCWKCEESVLADGPKFSKENVDEFFKTHKECDVEEHDAIED